MPNWLKAAIYGCSDWTALARTTLANRAT